MSVEGYTPGCIYGHDSLARRIGAEADKTLKKSERRRKAVISCGCCGRDSLKDDMTRIGFNPPLFVCPDCNAAHLNGDDRGTARWGERHMPDGQRWMSCPASWVEEDS